MLSRRFVPFALMALITSVVLAIVPAIVPITASAQPAPPPPVRPPGVLLPTPPPGTTSTTSASGSPVATATAGIVSLERRGRPVAVGFVLAGDGRVVTSLSAIGDGNLIDARYPDGSVVDVKVGHSDRVWNLALLVPQVGRWESGLQASSADPLAEGSRIRMFSRRGRAMTAVPVVLKGRTNMLGGDGEQLRDVIEITTVVANTELGTPLVDAEGRAVGVVTTACKPSEGTAGTGCRTTAFGAPMGALRQFLRNAPANATPPSPWLGIQGVGTNTQIGGVRVVHIHPGSPASNIELRDAQHTEGNDIIIAVDGVPVHSAESLAEQVRSKAIGDRVQLLILRAGRYHVVSISLSAAPSTGPSTGPSASPPASPAPTKTTR